MIFEKAKDLLTNPEKLKIFLRRNKKEVIYWSLFFLVIFAVYLFISSGDFSFFLTLSGLVQMFGFSIIMLKIYQTRSVSGLSKNTIILYLILLFCRSLSCMIYEGYIPLDKTGDWLYQIVEISSTIIAAGVLYLMTFKYELSYNADLDVVKFYYVIPLTLVLAILFHPSLNANFFGDVAWTFALYTEAVAMMPQLYLFMKKGGEIESFTSNFVASQGLSRLLCFVFWIFTFDELNDVSDSEVINSNSLTPRHSGYGVLVAQFVQLVLMADFFWQYIKSIKTGLPMTLPIYVV